MIQLGNIPTTKTFGYEYPDDLDLHPKSELHHKIVTKLKRRLDQSHNKISQKHDTWEEIDKTLKLFTKPDKKRSKNDDNKFDIVVPSSFINRETILTFAAQSMLESPIFSYQGVGPEDALGAKLMERLISFQADKKTFGLDLNTQWSDSITYGFGVVAPSWKTEKQKIVRREVDGIMNKETETFTITDERRVTREKVTYEGNILETIDPYSVFPDPSVQLHDLENAEFFGWLKPISRNRLLRDEKQAKSRERFNAKFLLDFDEAESIYSRLDRSVEDKKSATDLIHIFVDLIPEEWEISSSRKPQKYLFTLAGDNLLVGMKKYNLNHGRIPVAIAAPDYDGHTLIPPSRMEFLSDMQTLYDFLFNSHIQNVRKHVNDMLVVDPGLINIFDVMEPGAGKIIRKRKSSWKQGNVMDGIGQLNVSDITQNNLTDGNYIESFMNKLSGSNENLQGGFPNRTSRISSGEVQTTSRSSLSRIERMLQIISMQSMNPLGEMLASHTQQFISTDTYVDIAGKEEYILRKEFGKQEKAKISPIDLAVGIDLKPKTGKIPGTESASAWLDFFQILSQSPNLLQQFDTLRLVKHIGRQLGAQNIDDFIRKEPEVQTQIQDTQEVENQIQQGNLVPLEGQQQAQLQT